MVGSYILALVVVVLVGAYIYRARKNNKPRDSVTGGDATDDPIDRNDRR